jgi:hypothetical protein
VLLVFLILLLSVLPLLTLLFFNPYFCLCFLFCLHGVASFPAVPGVSATGVYPANADEPTVVGVPILNML